jgi:hypothetical protein
VNRIRQARRDDVYNVSLGETKTEISCQLYKACGKGLPCTFTPDPRRTLVLAIGPNRILALLWMLHVHEGGSGFGCSTWRPLGNGQSPVVLIKAAGHEKHVPIPPIM